jgi:hypothetical protein
MLCSHVKKFIYLKTIKTAGTSVEIFFEKYCCPPQIYSESHATNEIITEDGIIGYRGGNPDGARFYNHMPAENVRELLGDDIWNSYYKFCVVRNPFDKVVSMFWMRLNEEDRNYLTNAPFEQVRLKFFEFASHSLNFPLDQNIFMINGKPIVDFFIKFESLTDDIRVVCNHLELDMPIEKLGNYKSDSRTRKEHFSQYYDSGLADLVSNYYAWEIEKFNYKL